MRKLNRGLSAVLLLMMVVTLIGAAAPAHAQLGTPAVAVNPDRAGVAVETRVTFTAAGTMLPDVDWIRVTFPERTTVPPSIDRAYVSVSDGVLSYPCTRAPVVSDRSVTVYVPQRPTGLDPPLNIIAGTQVTVVFSQSTGIGSPWLAQSPRDGGRIPYRLIVAVSTPAGTSQESAPYNVFEWLQAGKTEGAAGLAVTVIGGGFTPESGVNLVDPTGQDRQPLVGAAETDAAGRFSMGAVVNEAAPPGEQWVIVQDGNGYRNRAQTGYSTTFTVLPTVTITTLGGVPSPEAGAATVEVGNATLGVGGQAAVDIWVRGVPDGDFGLGAYDIRINYDPTMLRIGNVSGGGPPFDAPISSVAGNYVAVAGFHSSWPGPTGDVRIARLEFTCLKAGTSELVPEIKTLANVNGDRIPANVAKGTIAQAAAAVPSPTPTATAQPLVTPAAVPSPTRAPGVTPVATATVTPAPALTPTPVPGPGAPLNPWVVAGPILGVLVVALAAYYVLARRRRALE